LDNRRECCRQTTAGIRRAVGESGERQSRPSGFDNDLKPTEILIGNEAQAGDLVPKLKSKPSSSMK